MNIEIEEKQITDLLFTKMDVVNLERRITAVENKLVKKSPVWM